LTISGNKGKSDCLDALLWVFGAYETFKMPYKALQELLDMMTWAFMSIVILFSLEFIFLTSDRIFL